MADEAPPEHRMHAPRFEGWTYNLNTLTILCGFAAGLVAWGYSISGWNSSIERITRVEEKLSKLADVVQTADRLEYRVTVNEANDKARDDRMDRFADVITSFRASLAEIITEIRVVSSKQDGLTDALKERNRDRTNSIPQNRP